MLCWSPFVGFYRHKGIVNVVDLPKGRFCRKTAFLRAAASERRDSFLAGVLPVGLELCSVRNAPLASVGICWSCLEGVAQPGEKIGNFGGKPDTSQSRRTGPRQLGSARSDVGVLMRIPAASGPAP